MTYEERLKTKFSYIERDGGNLIMVERLLNETGTIYRDDLFVWDAGETINHVKKLKRQST